MARLYFRIWLAVLGSLALLAVLAGATWRLFGDFDRFGPHSAFYPAAIEHLLPPAGAAPAELQAALDHWRALSGFDLALFDAEGTLLADTSERAIAAPAPPDRKGGRRNWRGPHWTQPIELTDGRWLIVARPRDERAPWRRFAWLGALAAVTLVVGICAYPVARRLTRRLEDLQRSVAALGAGDLSARVAVGGRDEVARLAQTFNIAAARIETLVEANRSLLANASHELRSPLARLRMTIGSMPPSSDHALRGEVDDNIRELDELIEEILLSSRLDAHPAERARFEATDIVALAAEECARGGAELSVERSPVPFVSADARLLRRLIRNLIENAGRHAAQTPIDVQVRVDATGCVELDVLDRGPGVADAERERIFEPFYRAAGSHEKTGGVGLGLALVKKIAEQHGGSVVCQPRDGGGSCFRMILPAAQNPDPVYLGPS